MELPSRLKQDRYTRPGHYTELERRHTHGKIVLKPQH